MLRRRLPTTTQTFRTLRESNSYYVGETVALQDATYLMGEVEGTVSWGATDATTVGGTLNVTFSNLALLCEISHNNAHHLREFEALAELDGEAWARAMQPLLRWANRAVWIAREQG